MSNELVPTIDLAADKETIVNTLRSACERSGFFTIINHGIDPSLQSDVFQVSKSFFALPRSEKDKVDYSKSKASRGYETGQRLEATASVDTKEGFYFSRNHLESDPRVQAGKFGHGQNQIPPSQPGFDAERFNTVLSEYYEKMEPLAMRLVRYLALSLGLPEDHFDKDLLLQPYGLIRLLHYPPTPAIADASYRGAGAHTDFGNLTLLMQDDVGGLEVWNHAANEWMKIKPVKDAYVVNLGDAIGRWTNDRYKSTLHRVINAGRPDQDRYSVPFFFSGDVDTIIKCLPTCVQEGQAPKYPPIKLEDHYKERYATTYGGNAIKNIL